MKWIKKNKFTVIAIVIFIVLAILGYKAKELFFPNQRTAIYGDRLDGKVTVEEETYYKLKQLILENDKVKTADVRENGRQINIIVTVNDDVSKANAKKIVDNILEPFTESQIGYYDYQVFIKKESEEENDFPIIGYKQHNSSSFVFTKDRDKTDEEE